MLTTKQRVGYLQWILPIALSLLSIFYQLILARWVHENYSETAHFLVEILFYAIVGPVIVFFAFYQIQQWLLEKEKAEHVARTTQQKLAAITEASADAIIGLTPTGRIESWNRGVELILGFSGESINTLPFLSLLGTKDGGEVEWSWLAETVQKSGFIRGYETTCRREDGSSVYVEVTASHMRDEKGSTKGFSIILRDIEERKKREAEIHKLNTHLNELVEQRTEELDEKIDELANANKRLKKLDQTRSEFVSLVSHQIRAPLTNINGAVEKMQTDLNDFPKESIPMLAIIDQQVERLDRLVKNVLNTNQIETGQLIVQNEPISIMPIVEQSINQIIARTQNHKFVTPVKTGIPLVYADPDLLLEILANLLDNAVKYTPAESETHVDVRANQSEATISIRDNGKGIPAGDIPQIFDKFYRSDSSDSQIAYGYGLGLYICRQLVEAMGGKIWAENHPSGGAVFSFTLSLWQEPYEENLAD
jgi:PAS domain S-box-containing protein